MDIKTTIVNLGIIGQLDIGMKLSTSEKIFVIYNDTLYQGVLRFLYKENRKHTFDKIVQLVRDINTVVNDESMIKNSGLNFKDTNDFNEYIKPIIEQAIIGLEKLKETYLVDKTYTIQLNIEIENLKRINDNFKIKLD